MNFKSWLLLNESIEENFDKWLETIFQYAKQADRYILNNIIFTVPRNEAMGLSILLNRSISPSDWSDTDRDILFNKLIDTEQKSIIKTVLKEKNLENYNWFAFSIGFLSEKPHFLKEDLELAVDVTKRRIDSRDLLKSEIGQKGWLVIGYEAKEKVDEYLISQQQLSNRATLRMKKKGETLGEDEKYIRLLIQEDVYKIYILPTLNDTNSRSDLKNRHMILCKYGKGTKWCTANPSGSYADYYANDTIYIVHKNDTPIYQFVGCLTSAGGLHYQFMDAEDRPVQELEKDVFNLLNKYLSEEINCYKITRAYSLEEILELPKKEAETVYEKISVNNIKMIVDESNELQAETILSNILKYRNTDWLKTRRFFGNKNLAIISFINKIGADKFIKEISMIDLDLINDSLLSIIIHQITNKTRLGFDNQGSEKTFDFIKKLYDNYPKVFNKIGSNNKEIIITIIKEVSKDSKDKAEEIINLLGDKMNLLSDESIEFLINSVGFNIIFPILNNRHSKIDTKLMQIILTRLSSYSGYVEKNVPSNLKRKTALLRSKIPTSSNTKAREMEFIKYILSKTLSTGAVEQLLLGKYLSVKSAEEKLEKIQEIVKLIGSDRITKIKNYVIKDMISNIIFAEKGNFFYDPEKEEKLKRGFIEIIKKYHKKLPADFFGGDHDNEPPNF